MISCIQGYFCPLPLFFPLWAARKQFLSLEFTQTQYMLGNLTLWFFFLKIVNFTQSSICWLEHFPSYSNRTILHLLYQRLTLENFRDISGHLKNLLLASFSGQKMFILVLIKLQIRNSLFQNRYKVSSIWQQKMHNLFF